MNKLLKWALLALGLMMMAWSGAARAESQYGYQTSVGTAISATARVGVVVNVPKIILLRVGATNTTVDTVTFTLSATITGTGTTAAVVGNDTYVDWNGTSAPTFTAATSDVTASAWTNASSTTLVCSMAAFSAVPAGTSPTSADLSVSSSGTLGHPGGANLSVCSSTNIAALGPVKTSTWTYTLSMTNAATWTPGAHTSTVTYTAAAP